MEALLEQIAPVEDESFINVCIYGDPGVGKTVLAATAPKPLFLDVENGFISVKNHPELHAAARRMRFIGVKAVERLAEKVLDGHFSEYETFVIDTFTALQDRALKEFTIAAYKKNPNLREDAYTPEGKDYQRNTEMLKHIVSLFRDAEKHVIFLCHSKEDKDERTGAIFTRPQLTPKLAGKLVADCSVVGHMTLSGGKNGEPVVRRLQILPSPTVHAKSRIGGLPAVLVNPHFDMFVNPENYTFDNESEQTA
jgi:phage nucleotide-binding protein